MAQIADVMHASAVFETACHESERWYGPTILRVYLGPNVDRLMEVLLEAEKRCVTSLLTTTREEEAVMVAEDEMRPIQEPLRAWLTRVKNVAYAMRAHVREKSCESGPGRVQVCLWRLWRAAVDVAHLDPMKAQRNCAILIARMRSVLRCIPKTAMVAIEDELWTLMEQYEGFRGSTGLPLATCTEQTSSVGQQSTITHDVPLGSQRGDDKQRIIAIITKREKGTQTEPVILPIFGPGGVGKTTLLKSVFSDPTFQDYTKAWVHTHSVHFPRETPSVDYWNKIYTSIIHQTLGAESLPMQEGYSLDGMKNHLAELFGSGNKKLLLVLHNLWVRKHRDMDDIKCLLSGIGRNLVVIVTTSNKFVAYYMSNTVAKPYQLQPLSHDKCWAIIKETSCFEARTAGNHQEAEAAERFGREIASKCCGLPLAAKALGRFLRSVDPQQWPAVVGNSQDIWNVGGGCYNDSQPPLHIFTVFSHLKHACYHLPPRDWLSFAACGFNISKGRSISRQDLRWQWLALGVPCYEDAHDTLSYLLTSSLFLLEKSASNAAADKDLILIRMEDLMYDFARYLLGDSLIVVDGRRNGATPSPGVNKRSSAYLAVVSNWDGNRQLELSRILPTGILALRLEDCPEIMELSDSAFSRMKLLRVLDLSGCSLKKLPDSIGQLKQLEYLKAPGIQDRVLPVFVTRLEELRFLSLRGSRRLSDLTEAFGRLQELRHLDLSDCSGLKELPKSLGRLWWLEHLYLSGCSELTALPNSFGTRIRQMRHLDLSGCSCVGGITEALGHSCWSSLEYLNLSHPCGYSSVEDWFHLKGLDALLPQLKELKFLGLSSCLNPLCYTSPPDECKAYLDSCIARLVELRHLHLSHNKFLEELPESIANLKELRTLDLSGCCRLKSLPEGIVELRELRALLLPGCFRLQSLPEAIGELQKLETLDLSGCPQFNPLPENVRQSLTKLQPHGRLTIITDDKVYHPCQAGSQEEQSEDEGRATTSQHASFVDESSYAESEITEES